MSTTIENALREDDSDEVILQRLEISFGAMETAALSEFYKESPSEMPVYETMQGSTRLAFLLARGHHAEMVKRYGALFTAEENTKMEIERLKALNRALADHLTTLQQALNARLSHRALEALK